MQRLHCNLSVLDTFLSPSVNCRSLKDAWVGFIRFHQKRQVKIQKKYKNYFRQPMELMRY